MNEGGLKWVTPFCLANNLADNVFDFRLLVKMSRWSLKFWKYSNKNDNVWREDSGVLTDKTKLPVKQLRFGDIGDRGEQGYHTLGKLKCFGIAWTVSQLLKKYLLLIGRLYLSLTVDYMKEINSFMPILSIRIVLSRFSQLIFFFFRICLFESDVYHLK